MFWFQETPQVTPADHSDHPNHSHSLSDFPLFPILFPSCPPSSPPWHAKSLPALSPDQQRLLLDRNDGEKGEFSTPKPQVSPGEGSGAQRESTAPAQAQQGQNPLPSEGRGGKRENRNLPPGIEERHPPGLVIQVNPEHLGALGQRDGHGGRGESLALTPAKPHGPNAQLGFDAEPALPAHGFFGHSDGPGGSVSHPNLPKVAAGGESLPGEDAAGGIEAFGVLGDVPAGALPPHAFPVLGQREPGVGGVRIQGQVRWAGKGKDLGKGWGEFWGWLCPVFPRSWWGWESGKGGEGNLG